jgi:O-antigen/teichoic acid export membrane protein
MSKDLIFLLYGSKYSRAPLLSFICYNIPFFWVRIYGSWQLLQRHGDPAVNLKSTLLYTGVFIPVAILLASILHVEGLLIAIVVTMAVSTLYSLRMAIRKYHVEFDPKTSAKIYLAAFLATIPIPLYPISNTFKYCEHCD